MHFQDALSIQNEHDSIININVDIHGILYTLYFIANKRIQDFIKS